MTLCHSFQEAARWVWQQMGRSHRLRTPYNEETITENLLMELKDRHPRDLAIVSFKKYEERLNGADWEWWFMDSAGRRGTGWRVQAKRLYLDDMKYGALDASSSDPEAQINRLIKNAESGPIKTTPIYCFYNYFFHWDMFMEFPPPGFPCCVYDASFVDWTLAGWAFAHAKSVKRTASNRFKDIGRISAPMHCAVCCPAIGGRDLPDTVHKQVLRRTIGEVRGVELPQPSEQIPDYVSRMINAADEGAASEQAVMEEVQAVERNITGVVVVRDNAPG